MSNRFRLAPSSTGPKNVLEVVISKRSKDTEALISCLKEKMSKPDSFAVYLTNRFHVAVRLFRNRSQITSKCSKRKK